MKKISAVLLAGALLLGLLPLSSAAADWVRVENDSSSVAYVGTGWQVWADGNDSGGSISVSDAAAGRSFSFAFTGTDIRYVARKHPLMGSALVAIDGGAPETVSLYDSGWSGYQKPIFEKNGLTLGEHTITVTESGGSRICLDYFEYKAEKPLPADLTLTSLTLEGAALTPEFAPSVTEYRAVVPEEVSAVMVTAEAAEPDKTEITVNGGTNFTVPLQPGETTILIAVTDAQSGESNQYTVVVRRVSPPALSGIALSDGWSLSPAFTPDGYSYTVGGNYASSVDMTLETADSSFLLAVNGAGAAAGEAVSLPLTDGKNEVQVAVSEASAGVCREHLTARWNFEGNAADSGPSSFPGQISGSVAWQPGVTGRAAAFSGGQISLNGATELTPDEAITLAAWIKPNAVDAGQDIIYKDQSFRMRIDISQGVGALQGSIAQVDASGKVNWYSNNAHAQTQPGVVTAGEWQHVAVTFDGYDVNVYRNGLLAASISNPARRTMNKSGAAVMIGKDFKGLIDDLRIYNTALSAAQIADIAQQNEEKTQYLLTIQNDIASLPVGEAIAALSGAQADTLNEVLQGDYARVYPLIGLNVEAALSLEDNSAFYHLLMGQKPFRDGADLAKKFNDALFLESFNRASAAERAELLRREETGVDLSLIDVEAIVTRMEGQTWQSMDGLVQACYRLNAAATVETLSNYQQLRSLVEQTAENLQKTIETATETVLAQAYKNVYLAVAASPAEYADFDKLLNAVNTEIRRLNTGGSTTNPPSGGGGGGGVKRTGGDYFAPQPPLATPEPPVEPVIKDKFSDLPAAHWAHGAVERMAEQDIISGYEDGSFLPDKPVTRAEFAKIASLAFELNIEGAGCDFVDVPSGGWAFPYIAALIESGAAGGMGDGLFGADFTLTREDMAVMIWRLTGANPSADAPAFADAADISPYAQEAVASLTEAGAISGMGDGRFAPKENVTRAQAAVLLNRIMQAQPAD